jgi:AcrR family transcriptional regulator
MTKRDKDAGSVACSARERPPVPARVRTQYRAGQGPPREGGHVVEMQHRRLLTATVALVYERGVQTLTVATVCERAGMSRRTFYEIFDKREQCLLAAFEDAVAQSARTVRQAAAGERRWRDRIRAGLTALLSFLDYEPGMGRLLIVDALGAGDHTLDARRRVLAQIITIVDEGRNEAKAGREPPPLTAEGVVGALFSVIHARMLERDPRPLTQLAGPLMAMIVQPYLGPTAAQRELDRPTTVEQPAVPRLPSDPFKGIPMRLTYRTARVLTSIAAAPGASNKQVAHAAGITDEGQTSKLLTRLQRYGLIHDTGVGPTQGLPRAWSLTERGEGVLQAVGQG